MRNPHRVYRSDYYRISRYAQAALMGLLANQNVNTDRLLDGGVALHGDNLTKTAWAIGEAMYNNRPTKAEEEQEQQDGGATQGD